MANKKLNCNQICHWNDSSDGCIKPNGRICPMSNTEPDASGWGQVKVANEKWLIDANKMLTDVRAFKGLGAVVAETLVRFIEKQPTVDAVEVVHGRWEDMWDGKYANPRYRCSVCKEKANYKSVQDELLSWHDVQVLTPYCPYCLAKLDGGIDNDIKTV